MDNSLPSLLTTLTTALSSTTSSLPQASSLAPPADSISLLTTKNELLLSYLHNLVFLILLKLRHAKDHTTDHLSSSEDTDLDSLNRRVVTSLVSLRVYLDKGVRPLEAKLKYQLDKVIRAADEEASRPSIAKSKGVEPDASASSEASSSDSDDDALPTSPPEINDLTYRPNPSSLLRPSSRAPPPPTATAASTTPSSAPYRPPRITATLPPTTTSSSSKPANRLQKSATLDEFLTTELSSAPLPEPSIGSNFTNHGRSAGPSAKERAAKMERKRYEESNFVRLPKESRKGKGKGREESGGYGGEDWRGLGEGADRVGRLVGSAGRRDEKGVGALERSRKREGGESGGGGGGGGKRRRG